MPALGDPCTRNWQDKHPAVKSTPKKDGSLTRRPGGLSRCVGRRDSGFGVSDPQGQLLNPTISMHAVLSAVGAPAPRLGQTAPAPAPRVCRRRGRGQTQDGRRRATRARAPWVSRRTLPAPPATLVFPPLPPFPNFLFSFSSSSPALHYAMKTMPMVVTRRTSVALELPGQRELALAETPGHAPRQLSPHRPPRTRSRAPFFSAALPPGRCLRDPSSGPAASTPPNRGSQGRGSACCSLLYPRARQVKPRDRRGKQSPISQMEN